MEQTMIYKPQELYERQIKKNYHDAAEQFYESLATKSGLDKGANAVHVRAYNQLLGKLQEARKALGSAKAGKGWTIFGIIMSFVLMVVCLLVPFANMNGLWWLFILSAACLALGIFLIVHLNTSVKNKVNEAKDAVAKAEEKANEALKVCYADMAGLNALLDDAMPCQVMEKATPIIDLDPVFSPERYCYLRDRFGMGEETDPDTSVLGVLSGHIQGNPFVLERVFRHQVRDKTYEGTLTISWTTTHTDSDGHTYTQHHTQTLHATTVHPAPYYWTDTRLIYGSEAAPHLHFSRSPSGVSGKSEKDINKYVKSRVKHLDKLEAESVKKGGHFQKLGNDEFDALFGADNRDNEVEYRLLFTPLAQTNLMTLIKEPQPFGDDFHMVKDGMLTSVATAHSQSFDYYADPTRFAHYDFEAGKSGFVSYCDEFTRNLFFDLAPILSIPAYQIYKPVEYIYGNDYPTNMTSFEHETLINRMDKKDFIPDGADTSLPLVLKQMSARKVEGSDEVKVLSRSYHTTPRVDYVSVHGGDGRWHDVPVHWTQYDEVRCARSVGFSDTKKSRPAFYHESLEPLNRYLKDNNFHFNRGLLAYFLGGEKASMSQADARAFDTFFTDKKED